MSCSDDNLCFDIGTQTGVFGVLENSAAVLATQTQKQCCSTLGINDYSRYPLMIIQTQDYRGREAPQFIAGSSH